MGKTNIGWTTYSWNPYTWNCTRVSAGCAHCYMFDMAKKLRGVDATGAPQLREAAWAELKTFKPHSQVFVNSMSDTYHEGVPDDWIKLIHGTAEDYPQLVFLLLTKRIERTAKLAEELSWPPNLWIGTTVEREDYLYRLDVLRSITQAAGRFVSFEPLLGRISKPNLTNINWVIVGGESGDKRRLFDKHWADRIWETCQKNGIPFFFKQGSARIPGEDRLYMGQVWSETPDWNTGKDDDDGSKQEQSQQLSLL